MRQPNIAFMSTDALRAQGIEAPWNFGIQDSVRFAELDILNHANNAAFVGWFENARISYFVNHGITDYVSEGRPTLVLRNLEIDYRAPLNLGDRYIVTARSVEYGRRSWTMQHAVFRDGLLCAQATCTVVTVDAKGSKSVPLSAEIIRIITEEDRAKSRE